MGYQKLQLNPGYNMVGLQFADIGGADKDVGTVFLLDETYAGYDEMGKFSTEMYVWNGNGYETYCWAGTSGTDIDGPEYSYLDNTWTDRDAESVEGVFMPVASAMWIHAEKTGTMISAGEVYQPGKTVSLNPGYNMIASPYAEDVSITTFGQLDASFAGYDEQGKFKTEMYVWNGNGYDTYCWAGTSGTDIDGPEYSYLDNTWTDRDAEETSDVLPSGKGVWIYAEKTGTISFNPIR